MNYQLHMMHREVNCAYPDVRQEPVEVGVFLAVLSIGTANPMRFFWIETIIGHQSSGLCRAQVH